jgi:hypothetical protein
MHAAGRYSESRLASDRQKAVDSGGVGRCELCCNQRCHANMGVLHALYNRDMNGLNSRSMHACIHGVARWPSSGT